jgi:hypothetical protein
MTRRAAWRALWLRSASTTDWDNRTVLLPAVDRFTSPRYIVESGRRFIAPETASVASRSGR